jgi:hypothetical protein
MLDCHRWFTFSSQSGIASFNQVSHGLNTYPDRVQVLVKQNDASLNNYGFIFEGMGSAQIDDDANIEHGGVVFGYDNVYVRLWAPDQSDHYSGGRVISVWDGWGGEVNGVWASTAQVKVLAWTECDDCPL